MKKIFLLIMLFSFTFILGSISMVNAEEEKRTAANADTSAHKDQPSSNFGHLSPIFIVTSGSDSESNGYFHFGLGGKPDNLIKAEIDIRVNTVTNPMDITVYLVNESWGEYTLTWDNKPATGEVITTFMINSVGHMHFDVSDHVAGGSLSICIKANSNIQNGFIAVDSRETSSYVPLIIWTYETNVNNGEPTIAGYQLLSLLLGVLGMLLFLAHKWRNKFDHMQ